MFSNCKIGMYNMSFSFGLRAIKWMFSFIFLSFVIHSNIQPVTKKFFLSCNQQKVITMGQNRRLVSIATFLIFLYMTTFFLYQLEGNGSTMNWIKRKCICLHLKSYCIFVTFKRQENWKEIVYWQLFYQKVQLQKSLFKFIKKSFLSLTK